MCSSSVLPLGVEYISQGQWWLRKLHNTNKQIKCVIYIFVGRLCSFLNNSWSDFGFIKTWHNIGEHKNQLFVSHSKHTLMLFFSQQKLFSKPNKTVFTFGTALCVFGLCYLAHTVLGMFCISFQERHGKGAQVLQRTNKHNDWAH